MIRLFRVFVPVGSITLLISEILLVTSAFVLATYLVLEVDPTVFLFYDGGMMRIPSCCKGSSAISIRTSSHLCLSP
jgi:hypothetical protein